MDKASSIVILTGAGISAESGIETFRDQGGLWARHRIEDVATPEGFARNPALVHSFYNERRRSGLAAKPNAAHRALARLQKEHAGRVILVTQNIDNLHEQAGSTGVIHMHGELTKVFCAACGARQDQLDDTSLKDICPACSAVGQMRPDIVWFGEIPYHMEMIQAALWEADVFISIGTSGAVYPAAGFVAEARSAGAETVELNLEPSAGSRFFSAARYGPATRVVPAFVEELIAA
ncbi:NAD-dependent deacylase [Consotaella salsifontis]|uniref:NAD-dependent protein deacylase n=1 Tax=Consotaella salsifontis TaxID=1365950 RepID=A0A1T4MXY5_9HYPH|nr:NAD-dependent deacylase [Consotaella salsifontis]SJZ71704.1 NAD-dependent deacetylase [Consotaella salsifontis]